MAYLPETSKWEDNIYQLETVDPVVGGVPEIIDGSPNPAAGQGIDNIQAMQLGNRTLHLKEIVDALQALLADGLDFATQEDINTAINGLLDGAPQALDTLKEISDALADKDDAIAALVQQIAQAATPIGMVDAFMGNVAPAGYIALNGETVTPLYPDLRAHLLTLPGIQVDANGDPILPDARAGTLRGLDQGRGIDIGRLVATEQEGENEEHDHLSPWRQDTGNLAANGAQTSPLYAGLASELGAMADGIVDLSRDGDLGSTDPNEIVMRTTSTGGPENVMRNVSVLWCVKAFHAINPTGQADLDQLLNAVASEAQAREGLNNTQLMTPLRTAQAITALAAQTFGADYNYFDVTDDRVAGITYQNPTDKLMLVSIRVSSSSARDILTSSNGADFSVWARSSTSTASVLVPVQAHHFYRVSAGTITQCVEFR